MSNIKLKKIGILERTATAAEETAGLMKFNTPAAASVTIAAVNVWAADVNVPFEGKGYVDAAGDTVVENVGGSNGFTDGDLVVVTFAYRV